MHWVVQDNIYSRTNLELLLAALQAADIEHTVVTIPSGSNTIEPDINPDQPVFVCGALKMAVVARAKGWKPGSLLNNNFHFSVWRQHLGEQLLNQTAQVMRLRDLALDTDQFIRPADDTKAFDGQVFKAADFENWKAENPALLDIDVICSPVRAIYREYRLFFVNGTFVTGSLYMQAGQPLLSSEVDPEAIDYAQRIVATWRPATAFALDIALTEHGYRIIEFNNINSSGFYASDVNRLVIALDQTFTIDPRIAKIRKLERYFARLTAEQGHRDWWAGRSIALAWLAVLEENAQVDRPAFLEFSLSVLNGCEGSAIEELAYELRLWSAESSN